MRGVSHYLFCSTSRRWILFNFLKLVFQLKNCYVANIINLPNMLEIDLLIYCYLDDILHCTKIKFSIKDFFSKCNQIHSFLRICSHLLKKSLMKSLCSVTERKIAKTTIFCCFGSLMLMPLKNVKIYATSECNFTQSFKAIGQETNGLNPYGF